MNPEIIIPASFFAGIFGIAYLYFTTRNKERMALIEKGASAELFNKPPISGKWGLKLGIMSMGIGLGIVIANLLITASLLDEDVAFPSMIFLFSGVGLVVSHYLAEDKPKDK
jgi:hypothetical protein